MLLVLLVLVVLVVVVVVLVVVVVVLLVLVVAVTYSMGEFVDRKHHDPNTNSHKAAPLGRLAVRKRSHIPGDGPDHEDQ